MRIQIEKQLDARDRLSSPYFPPKELRAKPRWKISYHRVGRPFVSNSNPLSTNLSSERGQPCPREPRSRNSRTRLSALLLVMGSWLVWICGGLAHAESFAPPASTDNTPESPQQRRGGQPERGVYKSRITPHWFANDTRFWYRNDLQGGAKEFILVDAEKGTREPAFDQAKLAAALSKTAGQEFTADKLPFSEIEFVDGGKAIKFDAAEKSWKCELSSYECTIVPTSSDSKKSSRLSPSSTPESSQLTAANSPADTDVSWDAEPNPSPATEEAT